MILTSLLRNNPKPGQYDAARQDEPVQYHLLLGSGKSAKGTSAGALVCLSVAMPITHNAVPEMKLAVAEKHIGYLLF